MNAYITYLDLINDFYPENVFSSIEEVKAARSNWKIKGIAEIEVDAYGRLSVLKYHTPEELSSIKSE
jgi:hypothetical protein